MRPSWDQYFLNIAKVVASMGTCARRQVGCVLVDERKIIIATGFSGVPPKFEHCRDNPGHECPAAKSPSGTNLDGCLATHAEANALLYCSDISKIHTVYSTTSPCIHCIKSLLCTRATRIVFIDEYPHPESKELWLRNPLNEYDKVGTLVRQWYRTWHHQISETTAMVSSSADKR